MMNPMSSFSRRSRAFAFAVACSATMFATSASAQVVATPDYHVVGQGDTLYDLSGAYYGDSYQWPKMWSYNAHITNPHWIYPGDIIYLRTQFQQPDAPQDAIVQQVQEGGMHLPVVAFVTSEDLEVVGRIVGAPKEANMLSPLDAAWVSYEDEDKNDDSSESPAREGDLFAVVRKDGAIKDSSGDLVGTKYIVLGSVRVTEVSDKYHDTVEVVQAWQEIERGDLLIPYERQLKVVQPTTSDKDMVAEIVDGIAQLNFYGEFYYVFINKGAEDGIRPGNRFFAYYRQEGLDFNGRQTSDKVPWRRVGQVMVLDVRENFSLAIVTDASRELAVGDRLEMYEGY